MSTPTQLTVGGRGEAGRRGDDVRSDLHVAVEPATGGDLQIQVDSKVGSLYGGSIREDALRVMRALGVEHARVVIDDKGALPWVIAARVEAATRRAWPDIAGDTRPPRRVASWERSARGRLRRSRLYLPGNEPKFMINAGLHGPDAVILDLEDSVHADHKDAARLLVRNALRSVDFGAAERMVRINPLPLGLADLDAIIPEDPDLILIPKTETAEQVRAVAERIRTIQAGLGPDAGDPVWLMPILESALGVEHAFAIATAADTVVALTIGLEDFTADLGVTKTREGDESLWARLRMVNAARAADLQAIDSVYGDVDDLEGLLAWGRRARGLGFTGMGCVHPRQIRVIHQAFAPITEEIEKAQRVVAAFQDAEARGLGVVSLGSKMIDPPVVLRARRLVERARREGLLPEEDSLGNGGPGGPS